MKNNFTNQASLILSNSFTSNHFILKATLISFFFLFISTSFAVSNQTFTVRLVDENGNILSNYPPVAARMTWKYRCGGSWVNAGSSGQQTNSNGEFDVTVNCTSNNWDGKLYITLNNTTKELTFSSSPMTAQTVKVNVNVKNSCNGLVTSPGADVQINLSGWPTMGNTNGVGTVTWYGFEGSLKARLASFQRVNLVEKSITLTSGVNEIDFLTSSVTINGATAKYPQTNSTPFSNPFPFLHGTYGMHLYTGTTYRGLYNINISGCQTNYYPLLSSSSGVTITQNEGLYNEDGIVVTKDAVDKTWQVTPSSNLSNVSLTFQWDANSELTGFDETSLGVYTRTSGYTGSGDWTLVNTGSATTSGSVYSYSVTGLTLNTGTTYYFGVTNSITPLPVSIIDFKGFVKNDVINLNWKVTDEKELSRYDIYSSVDGINYSVCGSVSATVYETGIKTYQFQDLSNKSALVYYKIKAINNDETGEWTSIVALHTVKPVTNKPLKVYPNPATDFINLEFEGIVPSYFNVLVMDMSGKVVYQLDGVETESNQYTLPLNGIESGMYIVKLSDEFGNTTINRFNIK